MDVGRYGESEPLYREAIAIGEKAYGREHPALSDTLDKLGRLLYYTGRFAEAEPFFHEAISVTERKFGRNIDVAIYLNDLANTLWAMGRYPEAERFLREALDLTNETLLRIFCGVSG